MSRRGTARGPSEVRISPIGDRPLEPLLAMLDASFPGLADEGEDEVRRALLRDAAEDGTLLVAELQERLVGFRTFGRVSRHPRVEKELGQTLYFAQRPELEGALRDFLAADAVRFGLSETVVEYFESPFNDPGYRMGASPFFGSSLVVDPAYRRKGVGAMLLRKGFERSRELGATEFFAYVITPSPAEPMCLANGFQRVLRIGPVQSSGSCRLLFGLTMG